VEVVLPMLIRNVAKLVAGSCAVYFVVAACSAYSEDTPGGQATGPDGSTPAPTATSTGPVPNALADGHRSGTRLKLRFWEGSDGAKQFIDFFDSELQTSCTVNAGNKTADGKVRCLPKNGGEMFFGDTGCKTIITFAVAKTDDPPKIGAVPRTTYNDYFQIGPLTTPPATIYRGGRDNTGPGGQEGCAATTPNTTLYAFYAVGAPLAPTAFVEMTMKTE
jgi:hypothetical protein